MPGRGRKGGGSKSDIADHDKESKIGDHVKDEGKCGLCKKDVVDHGLQCEVCESWFHISCQGIKPEAFEFLANEGIHWYCQMCNKRVAKLVMAVARLEARQDSFEVALQDTNKEVDNLIVEMVDTRKELGEVKEALQAIGKEVECIKANMDKVIIEGKEEINHDALEKFEMDKRRKNIILMGLQEGEDEREVIEDICLQLIGDKGVKAINFVERLGKRTSAKARPVRVVLNNQSAKVDILKAAKDLKKIKEYEKVYISPDLTKKQQEVDKYLRDKLKGIRNGGEKEAKIKKGKIVKIDVNGTEVVLYQPPLTQSS